jgi:hypothetical protein
LLKADYRVNRSRQSKGCSADRSFCAPAHAIGNTCVMGVKDYLHF